MENKLKGEKDAFIYQNTDPFELLNYRESEKLQNRSYQFSALLAQYLMDKIFKKNKYVFNYEMSTDGNAVSFLFLHKDYVEEEKKQKVQNTNPLLLASDLTATESPDGKYNKRVTRLQ